MYGKEIKLIPFKVTTIERREHPRFAINTDASLRKCPHCPGLGPLIDISMGGLSFCYEKEDDSLNFPYIDIYFGNDIFVLENIPFRKVITNKHPKISKSTNTKAVKHVRIQFDTLSLKHQRQLNYLIQLNSLHKNEALSVS